MKKSSPKNDIGPWTALRDASMYAMDKGLFVPFILGLILIIFAVRTPQEEIPKLFSTVLQSLGNSCVIIGIVLFVVIVLWAFSIRFILVIHDREMRRVVEERNKYQEIVLKGKIKSSEQ